MATLSTHVLDTASGRPAAGLAVTLQRLEAGAASDVASARTDGEGRIRVLGGELQRGDYRLSFDVAAYFGGADGLFRQVTLDIHLESGHYHVPLLASPYSAVSYRGS